MKQNFTSIIWKAFISKHEFIDISRCVDYKPSCVSSEMAPKGLLTEFKQTHKLYRFCQKTFSHFLGQCTCSMKIDKKLDDLRALEFDNNLVLLLNGNASVVLKRSPFETYSSKKPRDVQLKNRHQIWIQRPWIHIFKSFLLLGSYVIAKDI